MFSCFKMKYIFEISTKKRANISCIVENINLIKGGPLFFFFLKSTQFNRAATAHHAEQTLSSYNPVDYADIVLILGVAVIVNISNIFSEPLGVV